MEGSNGSNRITVGQVKFRKRTTGGKKNGTSVVTIPAALAEIMPRDLLLEVSYDEEQVYLRPVAEAQQAEGLPRQPWMEEAAH